MHSSFSVKIIIALSSIRNTSEILTLIGKKKVDRGNKIIYSSILYSKITYVARTIVIVTDVTTMFVNIL